MEDVLVKNAADEEQVKAASKKLSKREEVEMADLRYLMSLPQGKRFLNRLLSRCGVYRLSWNAENQHQTSFNEGRRNVGLGLLSQMAAANPEVFGLMQAEGNEEK